MYVTVNKIEDKEYNQKCLITHDMLIKCCILACYICRAASESAFEKMKYSLTAPAGIPSSI